MQNLPPKWMDRFLNWFCKPELVEEITGDMRELYFERMEIQGKRTAQARYALDILRFFRRSNIRFFQSYWSSQNSISMVKNYLTIAFRNLRKNPLNTVVNLLGLTIAVSYGIRAYAYYQFIDKMDQFHDQKEQVHLVTYFSDKEGERLLYGNPPLPLGAVLDQNFPEIEDVCRIKSDNIVVKHRDNVFYEQIWYGDPSFLNMLTFPLKWGSKEALSDVKSVIISEQVSKKYFAENNPVGVEIELIFSATDKRTFKVGGVASEPQDGSTMDFNFLIHFDNLQQAQPEYRSGNWEQLLDGMLVKLNPNADPAAIAHRMEPYLETYNEIDRNRTISAFQLEPIKNAYRKEIKDRFSDDYLIDGPYMILGTIALFLLILSCLNYTNIAIFTATKRLKEIGIRKSLGAGKKMIISQFLIENIFVASITIVLGYLLAAGYVVPDFEKAIGEELGLSIFDWGTIAFLVAILFVIALLSGIYPAFYVSRYQVSAIFRSNTSFGKRNIFTKVFLAIQLILAANAIAFSTMTVENATYVKSRSWGFDHKYVSYMPIPDARQFESVKNGLSEVAGVSAISGSAHHLGRQHHETSVEVNEAPLSVNLYEVDDQYFETIGFKMQEGRAFENETADLKSMVVNATFVSSIGLENPLGTSVLMDGEKYRIIGVVKDFHSYYFEADIEPTILKLMPAENYGYLSIRSDHENHEELQEAMKEQWAIAFPDIPYQGGHQRDVWGNTYWSQIDGAQGFFHQIAIICVLLVSLGLYGLVTLNVGGRIREFSIRKVLGAEALNVTQTILNPYTILFIVALAIAVPLSYFFVDSALGVIWTYHVPMNFKGITLATAVLVFVLAFVVFFQVRRVMRSNPVNGLRVE
ncbi:MAG: ABC transporter permease [Cytophagales bacterium]|nr:ABC transporter permease [Cytophagales bacterium]